MNLVIDPAEASATAAQPNVDVDIDASEIDVSVNHADTSITILPPIARKIVGADAYEGEYTFTPSQHQQTAQTSGKLLTANITINPIPQNYGLITWNGSTLTVS